MIVPAIQPGYFYSIKFYGMKKTAFLFLFYTLTITAFAQEPSKEQLKADKKRLAQAQNKLNEKIAAIQSSSKKVYDTVER